MSDERIKRLVRSEGSIELKQMHLGKIIGLAAALLLAACVQQHEAPPFGLGPIPASQAASSCPSQDFDIFLAVFMKDVDVQKAFTADPLQSDSIDAQEDPEPKSVTKMLSALEVIYPLIPAPEQQAEEGLVISNAKADSEATVKLIKPDSDYHVSYYFKHDACWMLYRKSDESL